jgi:hypothetical protein
VSGGLFSVGLGDTTVPGAQSPIPASIFANTGVRVRIWFSDGVIAPVQIADHAITSTGYAMLAQTVPDGSITSAKMANGSVTSAKIALGAVTAAELADEITLTNLHLAGTGFGNGTETVTLDAATGAGQGGLFTMRNGNGVATWSLDADTTLRGSVMSFFDTFAVKTVSIESYASGNGGALIELANHFGQTTLSLDADAGGNAGSLALYKGAGGSPSIVLDADFGGEGKITTQVLEITGGADFSENFEVRSPDARPGMLVCIDAEHPGELAVSDQAYDRAVAGVVSGAGGVKPGVMMSQHGTVADGQHPVALTGRVFCLVDADRGAIEPGDLITTSDTPGHGMKVRDHTRAQGAIIGKAMTPLASGRGLVLVLVSLQ